MESRVLFISERVVVSVIVLNTLALFMLGFQYGGWHDRIWFAVDYACVIYFVLEAAVKIRVWGWRRYWHDGWSRFDFLIVVASLPVLATPLVDLRDFNVVLLLRVGRLFRLFRLLRFLPDREHMLAGIVRALKASVGVLIAVVLFNFILAMGAMMLFRDHAPDHFASPFQSLYTMFQIFTVEGWYEVPAEIAINSGSDVWGAAARVYFVLAVLIGGILGLSLANAVFVDQMITDNTDELEHKVDTLTAEIRALRQELRARGPD